MYRNKRNWTHTFIGIGIILLTYGMICILCALYFPYLFRLLNFHLPFILIVETFFLYVIPLTCLAFFLFLGLFIFLLFGIKLVKEG
jgi:cytochrome c biogenesis factor